MKRLQWLELGLYGLIAGGIFFDLQLLKMMWLGVMLGIIFLICAAKSLQPVLVQRFGISPGLPSFIIGGFLALSLIGSLAGVLIVFGRLTSFGIAVVFLMAGCLFTLLSAGLTFVLSEEKYTEAKVVVKIKLTTATIILITSYILLVVASFATLVMSNRTFAVVTPWHSIEYWYIGLFFAATLLLGILLYYKVVGTLALGLLMLHGLLWHSFLPLTHPLIYGADGWRHIGNDAVIVAEQPVKKAVLSGGELSLVQKIDPGTFSYSQLWAIIAIINRLSGISLIALYAWFMPIVSALLFPLLFNELGRRLGLAERTRLLAQWLAFLPFALSSAGAFTLPVNYGLLVFLFGMVLLAERSRRPTRWQVPVLIGWGVLAVFGYTLYLVLFWLAWAVLEVIRRIVDKQRFKQTQILGMVAVFGLCIPMFELLARYSTFQSLKQSLAGLKQLLGNFLALYLANGPRPHDIATGNILFNQVPSYAFVATIFTVSRWWLVAVALAWFILMVIGWRYLVKKSELAGVWFAGLSATLVVSYGIGRYLLAGEQVLSRRLEAVIAICFVVLAAFGWQEVRQVWKWRQVATVVPWLFLVVMSAAITASYTLGPDTQSISVQEYRAMEYVWQQEKGKPDHCIIADTYPLLALEALSAREIIGGGFPIDQYFGQPELIRAYTQLTDHPDLGWPKKVWQATGAESCFVVVSQPTDDLIQWFNTQGIGFVMFVYDKLNNMTAVWEIDKNNAKDF